MITQPSSTERRFSSLAAMKAAHLKFIKQCPPAHTPSPQDLDDVEAFVLRGRATGVLLDSHDQQRDAQCLLDHWAGYLAKYRRDVDSTLDEYDPDEAPDLEGMECPYPGLEAFRTEDSSHFFGRSVLIQELAHRLKVERFLAVVGPSGSGKSSMILAGLVPALVGCFGWQRYLRVVPGADPLAGLAHAIGPLDDEGPGWLEHHVELLRHDPESLPDLIDATGVPTVLVVDQFEETFTICEEGPRQALEACLVALIRGSRLAHRLIFAMRSDYEGHLTRMPRLWPEFVKAKVALMPLGPSDLREAIEGPARQVGLKFEDGLVDALYSDVNGEAAALPLLQAVLKKLWQRRHRNLVTWEEYRKLGNGRVALGNAADEFYTGLIPEEQTRVKRIFIRLVRPAAGQEVTSNRITRRNLSKSLQDAGWVDDTIQRLRAAGLIRVTAGDTRADDEIEVAHEALVRNWPTLVDWLNQERSTMTLGRRLESRVAEWLRLGAGTAGLLDEESLAEVNRWRRDPDATLLAHSEQFERFLGASQAAIDRAKRELEEVRQREIDLHRSIAQQKSLKARQLRIGIVALSFSLVVAVGFAAAALQQWELAESRREEADQQRAQAVESAEQATTNAELAIANQLRADQETVRVREQTELAVAKTKLADDKVRLYDSGALAVRAQKVLPNAETSLLLALASARWIYPWSGSEMWLSTGAIRDALREARTSAVLSPRPEGRLVDAAFTPDGTTIVTVSSDGNVALWDAVKGVEVESRKLAWTPNSVAVSPDGRHIAVGGAGNVTLLDAVSLQPHCQRAGGAATDLVFSPDSRRFAALVADDVIVGEVAKCTDTPSRIEAGASRAMALSGNGYWIAVLDQAGKLRMWDAQTAKGILSITVQSGTPGSALAFKPDGAQIAVALDRSVKIFSTAPRSTGIVEKEKEQDFPTGPPFTLAVLSDDVKSLAYSRAGDLLAAAAADGTVTVWNANDRRQLFTFASPSGAVTNVSFSPEGSRIVTTGEDGSARIWSASAINDNDALLKVGAGYHLAVSRGGRRLGVYGGDAVHVLDPDRGSELRVPQSSRTVLMALDDASGRFAAASDRGDVTVYDATGRTVRAWSAGTAISALALSPRGELVVAALSSGGAWLWPVSGTPIALEGLRAASAIAFDPDGRRVVAAGDKVLELWDAGSGRQLHSVQGVGRLSSIAFSDDGRRISALEDNRRVRVWTANLANELPDIAGNRPLASVTRSSVQLSTDWNHIVTVSSSDGATLLDATGAPVTNLLTAKAAATEVAFLANRRLAVLTRDGLVYSIPVDPAGALRAGLSGLIRAWDQRECESQIQGRPGFCAETVPGLQRVAEGNRAARAGDVKKARSALATAIQTDPWLTAFIDPASQVDEHVGRVTALSKRIQSSSSLAQGESLAVLAGAAKGDADSAIKAIEDASVGFFEKAGVRGARNRMEAIANQAAREGAQVLVNSGKFVAGRIIDEAGSVDEEANALAERYFDRARRLDPTLTLDPQREVRVITAQKKIQWAKDFERIKSAPSLAVRIYGEVQKEFPDLITPTLWNSLCWQGSLFAATGPDSRRRAEAVSGACDEAVKHDPKNYLFVDSRGLNRLLVGKLGEAKTDFLPYAVSDRPEIRRNLRSRWIAALDARPDQNPITAEDVAQLRLWSNLPDK